jgi:hypothetical protein
MPKGLPTCTEPVSIVVAEGTVLVITIDPLTKRHLVECDICKKGIRLTKSAHPHRILEHWKYCMLWEEKRQSESSLTFWVSAWKSSPVQFFIQI